MADFTNYKIGMKAKLVHYGCVNQDSDEDNCCYEHGWRLGDVYEVTDINPKEVTLINPSGDECNFPFKCVQPILNNIKQVLGE